MSPGPASAPPEALEAFEEGLRAYRDAQASEAHVLFQRAYRRAPSDPRLMSWYGLTLVLVERNSNLGISLCDQAIRAGGVEPELVLNKADVLDALHRKRLRNRYPESLLVSARTGEGLHELRSRIAERFADRFEAVRLLIPHQDAARLSELYELGAPIEERADRADGVLVIARLPRVALPRFAQYLVAEARETSAARS